MIALDAIMLWLFAEDDARFRPLKVSGPKPIALQSAIRLLKTLRIQVRYLSKG